MGTRGTMGFVIKGEEKLAYNHFDSYPSGLGVETLAFLREYLAEHSLGDLRAAAERIEVVDDVKRPATAEDVERLRGVTDLSVGNQTEADWYNLLRGTQGDWAATLEAGLMEDGSGFPEDSLFCEWAYVLNLDDEVLEVYQGFQKAPHTKGRFASRVNEHEIEQGYWPVALVGTFSLHDLPSDAEFVQEIEKRQYHHAVDES